MNWIWKNAWLGILALILAALPAIAEARMEKSKIPPLDWHHARMRPPRYVKNEILVKFRENFTATDQAGFNRQMHTAIHNQSQAVQAFHAYFKTVAKSRILKWQKLALPAGKSATETLGKIRGNALVEAADLNYLVSAATDRSTTYTAYAFPNDPYYRDGRSQWWLNRTQGDKAMNSTVSFTAPGDVVVAVVDTGVDLSHPEFAGRLVVGYNIITPTSSPEDDNVFLYDAQGNSLVSELGHGTHVAGMVAAGINNAMGIAGTGYSNKIKVMPIKVLDYAADGTAADAAAGITWAVDNGAQVINLSFGIYDTDVQVLHDACTYAYLSERLLVAAAGNNNLDLNSHPYYPAVYPGVISVGATDAEDFVTSYSNYGSGMITLSAPGGALEEYAPTFYRDFGLTCTAMGGGFSAVDGTSFAAPQVSALAALLWAQNSSRTQAEVYSLLTGTCDNPYSEISTYIGAGRINVYKALGANPVFTQTMTPTMGPSSTITPTQTITRTVTVTPTLTVSATVTATPSRTASLTATATASPSLSRTITPTVTPTPAIQVSTIEIKVYPQPGLDHVKVAYEFHGPGRVEAQLHNVLGERVLHLTGIPQESGGVGVTSLPTAGLSTGVYFLRITVTDRNGIRQFKKRIAVRRPGSGD